MKNRSASGRTITKFEGQFKWLSNFYYCKVPYLGVVWPTSEHAYQAAKAKDRSARKYFASLTVPPEKAKRFGQNVLIRDDWDEIRLQVMEHILIIKFKENLDLYNLLQETSGVELVEGNHWHDSFWGVCSCKFCGLGENNLGKLLMKVRKNLR